jgi:hypothetical protein
VLPARYELDFYMLFRRNLAFKGLKNDSIIEIV